MVREELLTSLEKDYIGKYIALTHRYGTSYGIVDNINVEPDEDAWIVKIHMNSKIYWFSYEKIHSTVTILH